MKNVNLKVSDLKRIDYPHAIPAETDPTSPVALTPETILLSAAISLKRIADALDDSLITLMPDGSVRGIADIMVGKASE